jgi:hypothetical protein
VRHSSVCLLANTIWIVGIVYVLRSIEQDLSRQLQSLKAMRNTAAMLHVLHDLAATADVTVAQQSTLALTQQPHVFVPPSCDMNDFETQKQQTSNNRSVRTRSHTIAIAYANT